MKIGRLTVSATDAAKLRIRDWYSYHRVMTEIFRKHGSCQLLWHFCGAFADGLHFVFLTDGTPVNPPYTDLGIEMRNFPEAFLNRERYRFDVRVSLNRMPGGGLDKKAGLPLEAVLPKFRASSARWGFECEDLKLLQNRVEIFPHKNGKMVLPLYDITGTLRVTDPAVFKRAALYGIGPKLSFGCGLLRLYPAE